MYTVERKVENTTWFVGVTCAAHLGRSVVHIIRLYTGVEFMPQLSTCSIIVWSGGGGGGGGGANTKVPDMYGGGGVFSGPKTQK